MNNNTVKQLHTINNTFYQDNCDSFSSTRQSPWPGWEKSLHLLCTQIEDMPKNLQVFDLACGNLRFENFLSSALPQKQLEFFAVDNCEKLVPQTLNVTYQNLDVIDVLLKDLDLLDVLEAPSCDITVSFGFFHHIPMQKNRALILKALIDQTKFGGIVIVSFWQFLKHKRLAEKAFETHEKGVKKYNLQNLEKNDFLLGWNNKEDTFRYCHHFTKEDIDELLCAVEKRAKLLYRFNADGRSNNLNEYVILQTI